jgi:hypothetical protein
MVVASAEVLSWFVDSDAASMPDAAMHPKSIDHPIKSVELAQSRMLQVIIIPSLLSSACCHCHCGPGLGFMGKNPPPKSVS